MASGNFVLHKLHKAGVQWLKSQAPIADIAAHAILPALGSDKKVTPCIIVLATQGEAEDHASGNYSCELTFQLISNSDKDENADDHFDRTEALSNLVATDSIAADLSASLADFTCFMCQPISQAYGVEDATMWVSAITFHVKCCGSDVD